MEKFEIKSGVVVCSDPCYEIPTWFQGIISNVKTGNWYADIDKKDVGPYGERVHSITITHEDHLSTNKPFDYFNPIGEYGVDSGQFGFFDKDLYRNDAAAKGLPKVDWPSNPQNGEVGFEWYKACAEITLGSNQGGIIPSGVVASSGYGDGSYPVFGNKIGGEYVSLQVVFILEEDDQGEDYYEEEEGLLEYRRINLENGDYIEIKYDVEGIVYDRFDKNDEHIESYGYDLYAEIRNLKVKNEV